MKKTIAHIITVVVLFAICLTGIGPTPVSAAPAEVWVCPSGACGHANSYSTIQAGIDAVSDGGTVWVLAGTYNEELTITKPLNLYGRGTDATTIAGGAPLDPSSEKALITINLTSGNVTISGFKISNVNKWYDSVSAKSSDTSSVITFRNNFFYGSYLPNGTSHDADFGIIAGYGSVANVVVSWNKFDNYYSNTLLFEKQVGPTTVTHNAFYGKYGTIYYMTYNSLEITSLQRVAFNTFDFTTVDSGATAITFDAATSYADKKGKYTNVVVTDNVITNLIGGTRGINLVCGAAYDADGSIENPVVMRNKISGAGASGTRGITLTGNIKNARVQENTVSGVDFGFRGWDMAGWGYNSGLFPTGTIFTHNSVTNVVTYYVDWQGPGVFSTEMNWFGSATGPELSKMNNTNMGYAASVVYSVTGSTHEVGQTGTLDSNLTINGLYGAQLYLLHNPSVLSFTSGVKHNVPTTPPWAWDFVLKDFVTSGSKTELVGTMIGDDPYYHTAGANLTGESVATWTYTCTAPGDSALDYDLTPGTGTELSDINGFKINAALIGDSITCLAATASVEGYIQLQGRLDTSPSPAGWNDATVTLTCVSGSCIGFGPYFMTTDSTGKYQRLKSGPGTGVVLGTYSVSVSRRAYLGATKASNVVISALTNTITPTPFLLGGEVNGDGVIAIGDLTLIGGAFGGSVTPDTGPDVNGDGLVNIFDLAMAGGNYSKTASSWTP